MSSIGFLGGWQKWPQNQALVSSSFLWLFRFYMFMAVMFWVFRLGRSFAKPVESSTMLNHTCLNGVNSTIHDGLNQSHQCCI